MVPPLLSSPLLSPSLLISSPPTHAHTAEDPTQYGTNLWPTIWGDQYPSHVLQYIPWNLMQVRFLSFILFYIFKYFIFKYNIFYYIVYFILVRLTSSRLGSGSNLATMEQKQQLVPRYFPSYHFQLYFTLFSSTYKTKMNKPKKEKSKLTSYVAGGSTGPKSWNLMSSVPIYTDSLSSSWLDYSWATVNFASTAYKHSGASAIQVTVCIMEREDERKERAKRREGKGEGR